jgi:tagatose-6-phosphate ketose/aldose isomerase
VEEAMPSSLDHVVNLSENEKTERGLAYTPEEIKKQAMLWPDTCSRIEKHRHELEDFLHAYSENGANSCILTGAGTSEFVGHCTDGLFRKRLSLPTNVFSTTTIVTNPEHVIIDGCRTLMVSFARSGNSPESVGALRIADSVCRQISHLIITCNERGALMEASSGMRNSLAIALNDDTNDRGLAMTSSFSNMVVAAQAVTYTHDFATYRAFAERLTTCGSRMLEVAPDIVEKLCRLDFNRAVFLGSGSNVGTAIESHLKLQELTSGSVMCTFDTFPGLRHGPEAVIDEHTIVVAFVSDNPYVRRYELDLLGELKDKGLGRATVVSCATSDDAIEALSDHVICFDPEGSCMLPDELTPPVHVITGQLLGLFKSIALGFKPDAPSASGVINRVVKGVKVYDPVVFNDTGDFDIIAER